MSDNEKTLNAQGQPAEKDKEEQRAERKESSAAQGPSAFEPAFLREQHGPSPEGDEIGANCKTPEGPQGDPAAPGPDLASLQERIAALRDAAPEGEEKPQEKKGFWGKLKESIFFFRGNYQKFEGDELERKFGDSSDPLARFTREYYEKENREREDLAFMDEVDAAIHRRGHPVAYMLSGAVGLFFLVFFIWAYFAPLDVVTRGQGQVVPSQRVQIIQNQEGGILQDIYVREGDVVEPNQLLVLLDNQSAQSFYRDAYAKALEHEAALIRLEAELKGEDPVYDDKFLGKSELMPQIVKDQLATHESKKQQQKSEMEVLEAQYQQRVQESDGMVARKEQLEISLKLVQDNIAMIRPMVGRSYSKLQFNTELQKEQDLLTQVDGLTYSIPGAQQAAEEAKGRIAQRQAEYATAINDEISRRRVELTSLQESIAAGEDKVKRTEVRSKVRGTIQRILINTLGGVVKPGDPIMEIVPLDTTLLIEAKIRPTDRGPLRNGQEAIVKISTYDFSIYGGMVGKVEQISADTVEEKNGEYFYIVKLRTDKNYIEYRGKHLEIMPGMTATVDILTGKRSVLDYLLKPILKAQQDALTEK